jgi:hypothetical protein
MILDP